MRLILTRHGETVENREGIVQGHLPGRLSELGKKQAEKLAERLKDEHIGHIYSSDLARSADTAKAIARYHPDTPLEFVKELRERYHGEWQGKKKDGLGRPEEIFKKVYPKDWEPIDHLFERARSFLHQLSEKHEGETVLLVGHNGINRALVAAINGGSADDTWNYEGFGNASLSVFNKKPYGFDTELLDCKIHLDP